MKKTEKTKKLQLNREAIRVLTTKELLVVVGGVGCVTTAPDSSQSNGGAPTTCH